MIIIFIIFVSFTSHFFLILLFLFTCNLLLFSLSSLLQIYELQDSIKIYSKDNFCVRGIMLSLGGVYCGNEENKIITTKFQCNGKNFSVIGYFLECIFYITALNVLLFMYWK